ncbi:MAG TPA: hypothetical protein PKD90_14640 [Phnomibacter sp.]|nr:hypothetical protein [Phnomibacter sp.]
MEEQAGVRNQAFAYQFKPMQGALTLMLIQLSFLVGKRSFITLAKILLDL